LNICNSIFPSEKLRFFAVAKKTIFPSLEKSSVLSDEKNQFWIIKIKN